ncbi:DUF4178 domain-containing protein [Epibacterium sp. Ofav1-8]|uniref:DUF4178 domain-containing protein n=1 Tax=Epibacterium sp. Ofav1-8 TaxID=2917735 RepID=UPI001EF5DB54|nr:DUF4178 domain-containing protein [Epibacterium sp. Ofav1-8]MCG7625845.1 DUF4178 domain-containing protein [Epibacterium sp. Ofav1-8]
MTEFSCPNCGSSVAVRLALIKMTNCTHCGTTLVLDGPGVTPLGTGGDMHAAPMMFGLGAQLILPNWEQGHSYRMQVLGHARFSYGRGFWDEFWGLDGEGSSCWLSVDEGDLVLQWPLAPAKRPRHRPPFQLGEHLTLDGSRYRVVEAETATCEALRGSFDEALRCQDAHDFVNAQGPDGNLLSAEFWPGGEAWFVGCWIDPFELQIREAGA